MKYMVKGKEISIKNQKILFENEIVKVEDLGKSVILLLENTSTGDVQKQPLNNIIAIDKEGNILWRISEITKNYNVPYGIFSIQHIKGEGKVLIATDCMGIRYTIRLSDLKLLHARGYTF